MKTSSGAGALRLFALLIAAIFISERAIALLIEHLAIDVSPYADVVASVLLTATMFPILYYAVFKEISGKNEALEANEYRLRAAHNWLEQCIDERTMEIRTANEALEKTVKNLHDRQREMDILSQMGRLLQACHSVKEVCDVAEDHMNRLFPQLSGALYLANETHKTFEKVIDWGEDAPLKEMFEFSECWALRRGRSHLVDGETRTVACRHVVDAAAEWHLCLPLTAQNETLGLLCLCARDEQVFANRGDDRSPDERVKFFVMMADGMALSIASLRLRESLERQAVRDPLTGLFNRRYMVETLDRELIRARRAEQPLSLVMLDIDHFKQINDNDGHGAGDVLLEAVGAQLQKFVRGDDVVCRYGGEEFAIILPGMTADVTGRRIEFLRQEIKALSVIYQGRPLNQVTVSAGIAAFPLHGVTRESLMRATDRALYRSKQEGRDRITVAGVPSGGAGEPRLKSLQAVVS